MAGKLVRLKGLFGLTINAEDESVATPASIPYPLVIANQNFVDGVATRDVVVSDEPSVWARIFLPEKAAMLHKKNEEVKVPVILYFHGGAFLVLSPDISFYHQFCEKVARKVNAVVVSVDYRLAPEHKLPAAYDDAMVALTWLKKQAAGAAAGREDDADVDPWLAAYVDFRRCFLMGDSAGGNIVHHLTVAAGGDGGDGGVKMRGQILIQPMTGGPDRLRSEVVASDSGFFNYETNDWVWRLALPKGADMNHPYCNLAAAVAHEDVKGEGEGDGDGDGDGEGEGDGDGIVDTMVVVGGLDWMHDRQFDYAAKLRKRNREKVQVIDYEKGKHGFFIYECDETTKFLRALATFVDKRK